jgi:hypothetical protein
VPQAQPVLLERLALPAQLDLQEAEVVVLIQEHILMPLFQVQLLLGLEINKLYLIFQIVYLFQMVQFGSRFVVESL